MADAEKISDAVVELTHTDPFDNGTVAPVLEALQKSSVDDMEKFLINPHLVRKERT